MKTPTVRTRALVVALTGCVVASGTALVGVAEAAGVKHGARFAEFVNRTASPVRSGSGQRISARVRVLDNATGKPAAGKVWFVDATNAQASVKVVLGNRGGANLDAKAPAPGGYAYRVRYGGSPTVKPWTTTKTIRFTVAAPPPVRPEAAFTDLTRTSPASIAGAGAEHVVASVRVINKPTGKPAAGKVWFVDGDGVRISAKVALDAQGRASVRKNPAPGTVVGAHRYWVRYGGGDGVPATTSGSAITFGIAMPAPDSTLNGSFIAAPDYLNVDVGDLTNEKNWTPEVGNSWNPQTQRSIDYLLGHIADQEPDAFLVTGDLVNGRWGHPNNTTGVFGTPEDPVATLRRQAQFYYRNQRQFLKDAGLWERFHPAVGDHELGDNNWSGPGYGTWKRLNLQRFRNHFAEGVLRNDDGSRKFTERPVGTPFENTSYATMINSETLLVSVDVFSRNDNDLVEGVDVGVYGQQLEWLDKVLGDARRDGVRWIIVQGHAPVLPARLFHSSGMQVEYGADSGLWQTMKKHRVNLYIAGEVHTTSRVTDGGVTQLVTGGPVNTGLFAYLSTRQYDDRLELEVWKWDRAPKVSGPDAAPVWQGGQSTTAINRDYVGTRPGRIGSLTLRLDNTAAHATGELASWSGSPTFDLPLAKTLKAGTSASLRLTLGNGNAASEYRVQAYSNNTAVAGVSVTASGTSQTIKVTARKAGYADVTVRVTSPPGTKLGQLRQRDMKITVT